MFNEFLIGSQVKLLSWGMDAPEGRAERDHVEIREFLEEKPALKPGMDCENQRLGPEAFLVRIYADLEDVGVHVRIPSWILA